MSSLIAQTWVKTDLRRRATPARAVWAEIEKTASELGVPV